MRHAVELPLPIDFLSSAQAEAIQTLVVAQVAEHWLHGRKAAGDHRAAGVAVDAAAHTRQGIVPLGLRQEERHLARSSLFRCAQAPLALQATEAVAQRALELDRRLALDQAVAAVAIQLLARRADAGLVLGIEVEVGRGVAAAADPLRTLVPERVGLCGVVFLAGVARVALAVAVVGDEGGNARSLQMFQRLAAVVAGIGGVAGVGAAQRVRGVDDGFEQRLFRAGAMCLGVDDDLRLLVHGGDTGVALDHALAGGHLGRFVIGAVGQVDPSLGAFAILGVLVEPGAQLTGIGLQTLKPARGTLGLVLGLLVALALAFDHRLRRLFHLLGLAQEVGAGAAARLAGVARQLDPVDGEHLPPDQALTVTDREYLGKQLGGQLAHAGDELGQRGEVRLAVAGDGHEQHMVAAGGLHLAAADDAAAVGQQDDFQEYRWIVGGGAF